MSSNLDCVNDRSNQQQQEMCNRPAVTLKRSRSGMLSTSKEHWSKSGDNQWVVMDSLLVVVEGGEWLATHRGIMFLRLRWVWKLRIFYSWFKYGIWTLRQRLAWGTKHISEQNLDSWEVVDPRNQPPINSTHRWHHPSHSLLLLSSRYDGWVNTQRIEPIDTAVQICTTDCNQYPNRPVFLYTRLKLKFNDSSESQQPETADIFYQEFGVLQLTLKYLRVLTCELSQKCDESSASPLTIKSNITLSSAIQGFFVCLFVLNQHLASFSATFKVPTVKFCAVTVQ